MLLIGKSEDQVNPAITNYGPSGTAAFAELLRQSGYSVTSTKFARPRLAPSTLVIAFEGVQQVTFTEDEPAADPKDSVVASHVKAGGAAMVLRLDETLPLSKDARRDVIKISGRELSVVGDHLLAHPSGYRSFPDLDWYPTPILMNGPGHFAEIGSLGDGTALGCPGGTLATNRFIAEGDNAEILLRMVRILKPAGGDITFVESTFRPGIQPGLTAMIGPWAEAAWFQLLFLAVIVVWTLGLRFGFPEQSRRQERGQRELLDAIADTYRRAKRTEDALESAYATSDRRLRKALKIPRDANDDVMRRTLPADLYQLLQRARDAGRVTPNDALALAQKLEKATDQFLSPSSATSEEKPNGAGG